MKNLGVLPFMLTIFVLASCVDDSVPKPLYPCDNLSSTPTYDDDIRAIIDTKCASAPGCHNVGSTLGDYSTFQGMEEDLPDNINLRVLVNKDMPIAGFPQLTQEELTKISCWLDAGHPEN